jgi:serine/threonine protein kinase
VLHFASRACMKSTCTPNPTSRQLVPTSPPDGEGVFYLILVPLSHPHTNCTMLIEAPYYCWFRERQPRAPVKTGQSETNPTGCHIRRRRGEHAQYEVDDELPFVSMGQERPGSYGLVDKVRSKTSEDIVFARKCWWKKDKRSRPKYLEEIRLLFRLDHWHVVEILSSYQKGEELGFLMAPFADIDLRTLLQGDTHPKSTLKRGIGCLVTGISFLHREQILHGDIKPANILLHNDRFLYTDFGCSKDIHGLEKSATEATVLGTETYAAPELFDHLPRGRSADIFSLGCVLLEIFSVLGDYGSRKEEPTSFLALSPYAYHILDVEKWLQQRVQEHDTAIKSMWLEVCSRMLQVEPKKRPRAAELQEIIVSRCEQGQKEDIFCKDCIHQGGGMQSSPVESNESLVDMNAGFNLALEDMSVQVSKPFRHHGLLVRFLTPFTASANECNPRTGRDYCNERMWQRKYRCCSPHS